MSSFDTFVCASPFLAFALIFGVGHFLANRKVLDKR